MFRYYLFLRNRNLRQPPDLLAESEQRERFQREFPMPDTAGLSYADGMPKKLDPGPRARIIEICHSRASESGEDRPILVSVPEFFDGNCDLGSIGCNLTPHPGLKTFEATLTSICRRANVQDVRIGISDLNEDDLGSWPFSDMVYIMTMASISDVESWVAELLPDEVAVLNIEGSPIHFPALRAGYQLYYVWWD